MRNHLKKIDRIATYWLLGCYVGTGITYLMGAWSLFSEFWLVINTAFWLFIKIALFVTSDEG